MNPCPHCRDRVDELEDEVRQLKVLAFGKDLNPPSQWRLTSRETVLIRLLALHDRVRAESFLTAMTDIVWDYDPEPKIFDVYICKLRKKLAPFGVEIVTHWGAGYAIEEPIRGKVKAAMSGGSAVVGPPVRRPVLTPLGPLVIQALATTPAGLTATEAARAFPGRLGIGATMCRLASEGLISREHTGRAYRYFAISSEQRRAS